MDAFLRDLMAHAEWANAVFFNAWAKSPARDHEELRSRVGHIVGVQHGFLSVLHGEQPGGPPGGPPPTFADLKARAESVHAGLRDFAATLDSESLIAYGAYTLVSGSPLVSSLLPKHWSRSRCTRNTIAANA